MKGMQGLRMPANIPALTTATAWQQVGMDLPIMGVFGICPSIQQQIGSSSP